MKKLLLILLVITGCSSPESKIESIVKEQLKKYPPAKLEGLEVKVYKETPLEIYSEMAKAELKEYEFALSLSSKKEQDSISSNINRYRNLMSTDQNLTYYYATAVVMKSDTALYNKYYFDDKMNLLYEDRIK